MPAVCLMQLLPDELFTQIIIHSIKDKLVFHFLNFRNKICGTFRCIYDSGEVLLHVLLRDLREVCKNRYIRSCFEWRFHEANHL
jgi:NADPH-dependent 7-cyano-7-deazaguanine reductase QueF